jgi:hypothetical protein
VHHGVVGEDEEVDFVLAALDGLLDAGFVEGEELGGGEGVGVVFARCVADEGCLLCGVC